MQTTRVGKLVAVLKCSQRFHCSRCGVVAWCAFSIKLRSLYSPTLVGHVELSRNFKKSDSTRIFCHYHLSFSIIIVLTNRTVEIFVMHLFETTLNNFSSAFEKECKQSPIIPHPHTRTASRMVTKGDILAVCPEVRLMVHTMHYHDLESSLGK